MGRPHRLFSGDLELQLMKQEGEESWAGSKEGSGPGQCPAFSERKTRIRPLIKQDQPFSVVVFPFLA